MLFFECRLLDCCGEFVKRFQGKSDTREWVGGGRSTGKRERKERGYTVPSKGLTGESEYVLLRHDGRLHV